MAKKKADTPADKEADRKAGDAARWKTEIRLYERESEKWTERSKKIIKRYKDEKSDNSLDGGRTRFNVLWSNVQTMQPALFAKNPVVNVERRFHSDDDIGRVASQVLERDTGYFVDDKYFDCIRQVVLDRLLSGRGTAWVRYLPKFTEDAPLTDDAPTGELYSEEVVIDYVHWQDFGCTYGRTWEEVTAGWRKVYMDRAALVKRFDKVGKAIPLDHAPEKLNDEKIPEAVKKATIYEIWDKSSKRVVWLHKDYPTLLDEQDDPLHLKEFYPFPRPLFATLANDSIIPVPDYAEYQDQAQELDEITARISLLTKAVKVAGVYASDAEAVQRLLAEGLENTLIPVESWAMFAEKGGLKGIIEYLPLEVIVSAIAALYEVREHVKHDLYEISGISDIIRGDGDANETATGVKTKGQFATLRLNALQADVARFNRDLVRIMAEIISEHFEFETIKQISGVQLLTAQQKQMIGAIQQQAQPGMPPPQLPPDLMKLMGDKEKLAELMLDPTWEEVHELLTNDTMRCFRIDIETDSTIKMDQDKERQDRMEFLTAAGGFIQQAVTIQDPDLAPLLFEMLMFGVRGFHVGKDLESAFNVAQKKMQQKLDNPQEAPPDPEMAKVQMTAQIEQMKMQQQEAKIQGEMTLKQQEAAQTAKLEQMRLESDQQIEFMKLSQTRDIELAKLQQEGFKLSLQKELDYAKMHSTEKQTRATIKSKQLEAEAASDDEGLATEDGAPSKLDTLEQGQQSTLQAIAQQQAHMEQQMQALLQIAGSVQQAVEGIQQVKAASTAKKRVIRDKQGRVSGVVTEAS